MENLCSVEVKSTFRLKYIENVIEKHQRILKNVTDGRSSIDQKYVAQRTCVAYYFMVINTCVKIVGSRNAIRFNDGFLSGLKVFSNNVMETDGVCRGCSFITPLIYRGIFDKVFKRIVLRNYRVNRNVSLHSNIF